MPQFLNDITDFRGDDPVEEVGDARDLLAAILRELREIRIELASLKDPGRSNTRGRR